MYVATLSTIGIGVPGSNFGQILDITGAIELLSLAPTWAGLVVQGVPCQYCRRWHISHYDSVLRTLFALPDFNFLV